MKFRIDSQRDKLLILLILTDFAFVAIHILHKYSGLFAGNIFSIEYDNGYAEIFQYVKEFWIILLLFYLFIKESKEKSKFLYFSWALLFCYLLFDDVFQIHEKIGGVIGAWYTDVFGRNSMLGLGFQHYGELSMSAFSSFFFLVIIGVSHYLSNRTARNISRHLFYMLIFLFFFGVGIDMVHEHVWIHKSSLLVRNAFGLVEDGGEMLVMSFLLWYVFSQNSAKEVSVNQRPPAALRFSPSSIPSR